jgi:TIR domain-containing protein
VGGGDRFFDAFFSYHWRDHTPVELVARTLTERGFSVFLDRRYLTAGQPWRPALARTLASRNSVAVFGDPAPRRCAPGGDGAEFADRRVAGRSAATHTLP